MESELIARRNRYRDALVSCGPALMHVRGVLEQILNAPGLAARYLVRGTDPGVAPILLAAIPGVVATITKTVERIRQNIGSEEARRRSLTDAVGSLSTLDICIRHLEECVEVSHKAGLASNKSSQAAVEQATTATTVRRYLERVDKYRAPYREIRNRVVDANNRLSMHIAKKCPGFREDRFQDGCIGLIHACERYDPSTGFSFSTYATWWIRQAVSRGREGEDLLRVPAYLRGRIRDIENVVSELGEGATTEDIGAAVGLDATYTSAIMRRDVTSIDHYIGDNTKIADMIRAADNVSAEVERRELSEFTTTLVARLPERIRTVIQRRYGGHRNTLNEIAIDLNISRERVRQLEVDGLERLRRLATPKKADLKWCA